MARSYLEHETKEQEQGEEDFEGVGPLAFMARRFGDRFGTEVFLLDCAATSHMVDDSVVLHDEVEELTDIKGVADVTATGKGTLIVGGLELRDVLKVPNLGVNLISEGVLHGKGCDIVSNAEEGSRKVYFKGKVIIEATYEQGLFIWRPPVTFLTTDPLYPVCLLAAAVGHQSEQHLWHLRLGHLNYADMDKLKGMSVGMDYSKQKDHGLCVACCKGKLSGRPFRGHNEKAERPYQVIYADLWGPVCNSLQGHQYAMLLVDEATSYTWAYFLAHKSQAADIIKAFIVQQERCGNFVQVLRTDNGGEFSSSEFKHFLWERGLRHATSPPYTPQYQGKVERMNRTVGEKAHSMRVGAGLPESFWELAWDCAVFLRNRSPTSANGGNMTPYEMIFGKKPRLDSLRVFGCRAEALVPGQLRSKGGDKSASGIFVGYDDVSRAYKFLRDGSRKWVPVRTLACDEKEVAFLRELPGGGGAKPDVGEILWDSVPGESKQHLGSGDHMVRWLITRHREKGRSGRRWSQLKVCQW